MNDESNQGTYRDGLDQEMSNAEVREMLRDNILAAWRTKPYNEVETTLHRDGGATIKIRLSDDDVRGLAHTW